MEVRVPQMGSPECARIVQEVFNRVDGIEKVDIDIANHRIFVTFDGHKTAILNMEYHLTSAGFDANDKPARPEARAKLPAECR